MVEDDVSEGENLGREVFSQKAAKRARRNRILFRVFLEKEGTNSISVDRLDYATAQEALDIGNRNAVARSATFYGWAVVTGDRAMANQRRVLPSPTTTNPFHADILLPDRAILDREEQKQHAQNLADEATWKEGVA